MHFGLPTRLLVLQNGDRPVLAVKTARVGDYNGKTISTINSTVLKVQPQIPEAQDLAGW